MYLELGNTKLFAAKSLFRGITKIEVNFEYPFVSQNSYRRFANVVADLESKKFKIKIKSEFGKATDCEKLSQLLIGIGKIVNLENIITIEQIIEGTAKITPQDFLKSQDKIIKYFL